MDVKTIISVILVLFIISSAVWLNKRKQDKDQ